MGCETQGHTQQCVTVSRTLDSLTRQSVGMVIGCLHFLLGPVRLCFPLGQAVLVSSPSALPQRGSTVQQLFDLVTSLVDFVIFFF